MPSVPAEITERLDKLEQLVRRVLDVSSWKGEEWIPELVAARRLGSKRATLRNWRYTGEITLRYSKVGRSVMYLAEDISALLRSRAQTSTAENARPRRRRKAEAAHVR